MVVVNEHGVDVTQQNTTMDRACGDVLRIVFSFTNSSDVHMMPLVCKRWHMLMKTLKVAPDWTRLSVRDVGLWSKCFPLARTLSIRKHHIRKQWLTPETWSALSQLTHLVCDFVPEAAIRGCHLRNVTHLILHIPTVITLKPSLVECLPKLISAHHATPVSAKPCFVNQ
jgi:hypothetical protein